MQNISTIKTNQTGQSYSIFILYGDSIPLDNFSDSKCPFGPQALVGYIKLMTYICQ